MSTGAVRFSRVVVFRAALVVGVLVVAVCWAVVFLGYLLCTGLSRITPRAGEAPRRDGGRATEPASDKTRRSV